jgi:hypothetical protein
MSTINPSPDLLTILLPMKPAIKPRAIQAKNDIWFSFSARAMKVPPAAGGN